jgi:hypothetical protein
MYGIERATGDDCYPSLGAPELALDLFAGLPAEESRPQAPLLDEGAPQGCYEELTLRASPEQVAQLRADAERKPGWKIVL